MSDNTPKTPHVLIVGAGITGLLIAHGLQQAGVPFTVFEQEDPATSTRNRDWTVGVHWASPVLKKLLPQSLRDRLPEAYCDPFYPYDLPAERVPLYNGQTGEILKVLMSPGMNRFSRSRLRALCAEGIPIQHGKVLADVTYDEGGAGVTVRFADSSEAHGDVLIGTDGASSFVRQHLLGAEKGKNTQSELLNMVTVVNYGDAERAKFVRSADPITSMAYHPDGMFSFISVQNVLDPDDATTWTFQFSLSWLGDPATTLDYAARLAEAKKRAEHFAEPFRSAALWIPEGTPIFSDRISYWTTVPWNNHDGRVTLAGDAAHAMPPYRGQGLNHCIVDAANLVSAITTMQSKAELSTAISNYEAEMIPRGRAEVELSVENSHMVHDWSKLMNSAIMKMGAAKTN